MTEKKWTDKATKAFAGKIIKSVEYLTKAEAEKMGWFNRPLVFIFTDGTWMFAMQDDEGNSGGSYATSIRAIDVIPTLSLDHDKIIARKGK